MDYGNDKLHRARPSNPLKRPQFRALAVTLDVFVCQPQWDDPAAKMYTLDLQRKEQLHLQLCFRLFKLRVRLLGFRCGWPMAPAQTFTSKLDQLVASSSAQWEKSLQPKLEPCCSFALARNGVDTAGSDESFFDIWSPPLRVIHRSRLLENWVPPWGAILGSDLAHQQSASMVIRFDFSFAGCRPTHHAAVPRY